ncbi:nuclear transport factor 2 family protein [Thalassolituus sp. LLYu03]|uniref:nuclear transport factor 2 family protein n=1 Tax=Thalassolituus sp. LLYu03 TaxID=3421656 RepID=UPI003D2830D2
MTSQARSPQDLITTFYTAFSQRDYATMAACYHPQARFNDPVFSLAGEDIGHMWRMLCERAEQFSLTFTVTERNGQVTAHWEPRYRFSQTGRMVHNIIDARFRFQDGLIIEHDDVFSFWRWSRQALGMAGVLLGWTPLLQQKVKAQAGKGLRAFIARLKG